MVASGVVGGRLFPMELDVGGECLSVKVLHNAELNDILKFTFLTLQ
ncbi:hypothetical protein O97_00038 [Bartonella henselae str. Zeus]|nr:hypothetical protein [Bartonella henselae]ETS10991.1 hypothetical protein Q653_00426 [Bartonella henselae JK 42]KEC60346.1 hypothetical protein O95_00426 [Bartonella henselae JK 53]KEC60374.1 hypothetical protein O97_00038 [Bartonella henselae str. Zeus]MDM9985654.1 hypothetical protein [Bartonella henselae]MDN0001883.1 hypothetical protein [Bartonella henselae]